MDEGRPVARLLMCAPDAYGLEYEINPWMSLADLPDVELAARQWAELRRTLGAAGAAIDLVAQAPNAPDMVFTANAGLVAGTCVLLSRFRYAQRQVEVGPLRAWFQSRGYDVIEPPEGVNFEGEGDALFAGDLVVAGYLKRSDIAAHRWVASALGVTVLSVELVDPRWYHLDTAFFALTPKLVAYYPGAFDAYGRTVLEANFEVIRVTEAEALQFACNSVVLGRHVLMPAGCPALAAEVADRGFTAHPVEMSEFMKSGGAAKCLTLFLDR